MGVSLDWAWIIGRYIVSLVSIVSNWMGNGQLALIWSRNVASPQGLLNKASPVDFNREALISYKEVGCSLVVAAKGGSTVLSHIYSVCISH